MPKRVRDGVDNAPVREAVLRARARGEISLSELAREMNYLRPHTSLLKRMLGITHYAKYSGSPRQTCYAMKRDTAVRLWALVSDEPPNFQAPPEGYGNGSEMVVVEPIREAVLQAISEQRCTFGTLARDLGYFVSDTTPLRRRLGLKIEGGRTQDEIEYDVAVWLTNRLGLDPHETGV